MDGAETRKKIDEFVIKVRKNIRTIQVRNDTIVATDTKVQINT